MRVLLMMECSGRSREAFRLLGHDAVSCDILPTEIPGPHSTLHWYEFLERYPQWDLMIAHPPCTYLTVSGNRWFYHPEDKHLDVWDRRPHPKFPSRWDDQAKAIKVIEGLWNQRQIKKVVIENPIGAIPRLSPKIMGKPTQIIQPWWFGDPETKATCLWERGVQPLVPKFKTWQECAAFNNIKELKHSVHKAPPGEERQKDRSRTFQGIANAFAAQWG